MESTSSVTSTPEPTTRWPAARIALTGFFALDGFLFAGWVVRIPEIKAQVHASPALLGLALLCVSAGAVAAMGPVGRLCVRHGNHAVTVAASLLLCASVALPPLTHSVLALGLVLLLFGAGYGAMNVGINSAAVDFVRAAERPVMPSFHAAYSLGGLLGATLGGLLAPVLTPTQHLGLLAVGGLAVTAWAGRVLLRHEVPHAAAPAGAASAPGSAPGVALLVVLLGVVALCDAYGEGAMADWGALHLRQDLHASSAIAATGFAVYSLTMTIGRLSGTRLVERFGPTKLLVAGAAVASVGMVAAAVSPSLPLALAGFLLVGLGLANIFPLAIDRAGSLRGPRGVATASTLGFGGMVAGPPIIGFLAQGLGLPLALLSVALLIALAGVSALVVRAKA
ncbi:MFS transporter [Streptacidiphilus jiangxiensis]|uniref:Fucose permease n=1 Tax=Streptacidiphilus jiangxiensis TaxID=235985 RepID=A0A1H7Z6A2_STRJI|nr:MFS transporter [Streptacidiphilus jiangxiensis]SEM53970.1 Fucose permease [Streptacidiphilus jiangxiensis]